MESQFWGGLDLTQGVLRTFFCQLFWKWTVRERQVSFTNLTRQWHSCRLQGHHRVAPPFLPSLPRVGCLCVSSSRACWGWWRHRLITVFYSPQKTVIVIPQAATMNWKVLKKSSRTKPWNPKIEKTVGPFKLTTIELIHLTYPEPQWGYTIVGLS